MMLGVARILVVGVDGPAGGHYGMDPDVVDVFPVGDRAVDVCFGDDAGRWPVCAFTTVRAVVPACFIRYAAAATWSYWPTVVSGGRMTFVTMAVAARG